uniref:Pyrin domain-containing protein n=1 Tax=Cyprinodon variegatus TaxID=28743 RepID=A0A3Q2CQ39_CYPVA
METLADLVPSELQIFYKLLMKTTSYLVLETLNDLKGSEFMKFKWFLQLTQFQRRLPQIPWSEMQFANRTDLVMMILTEMVNVMVEELGAKAVEETRKIFKHMNRADLLEVLPETCCGTGQDLLHILFSV